MEKFIYVLGLMVVFASILFLAYISTKYIGSKAGQIGRGKYLRVIETICLGKDRYLHLIKAGEEFILVSSSVKGIEVLKSTDEINMDEISENADGSYSNNIKVNLNRIGALFQGFEYKKK
ncbi:MAG TPA: flagellar biosynthetic protein FliO [Clostridiales bacterium]|nr:flagellar biosynthetic protein FliO [Clostridiales bacterium]